MIKQLSQLFGVAAFLMVSGHSVQAATFQDVELGGVNLSAWCAKQHGSGFKAKMIHNPGNVFYASRRCRSVSAQPEKRKLA